ncbi:hypothetical protein [Mesorhizobium sp. 2RAF21]
MSSVAYVEVEGIEMLINNFMRQPQVDATSNWLHVFRYPVQ